MNDALEALLKARQEDPFDLDPWLEAMERLEGAPGEALRLQGQLRQLDPASALAAQARGQLAQVLASLPATTRALLCQPQLMQANVTPYPQAWWSFGLGAYRPELGTYTRYAYSSLPPLPAGHRHDDFSYLPLPQDEPEPQLVQDVLDWLAFIQQSAASKGLTLPSDVVRFFERPQHMDGIASCTGCVFDLDEDLWPDPSGSGAWMMRVYADSQDCLSWYLWLHPSGASAALVGDAPRGPGPAPALDAIPLYLAAPTFSELIWRLWIENELWDVAEEDCAQELIEQGLLTTQEQDYLAYLKHYFELAALMEEPDGDEQGQEA